MGSKPRRPTRNFDRGSYPRSPVCRVSILVLENMFGVDTLSYLGTLDP